MKNPKIALMLKQYRKRSNLTVQQVSELLAANGYQVAPKTIYGWESGATQPDADTLMFLCELYDLKDVLSVFGYRKNQDNTQILNSFEKDLITNFRNHPEMQNAVLKLLDITPSRVDYLKSRNDEKAHYARAAEDSNWKSK